MRRRVHFDRGSARRAGHLRIFAVNGEKSIADHRLPPRILRVVRRHPQFLGGNRWLRQNRLSTAIVELRVKPAVTARPAAR
jgi:hypothetical protein